MSRRSAGGNGVWPYNPGREPLAKMLKQAFPPNIEESFPDLLAALDAAGKPTEKTVPAPGHPRTDDLAD